MRVMGETALGKKDTGTLRIMGPRPTTIIVESRLLIRKALKSLMTESSYRVVCEVGSISGIGLPTIDRDEPGLVILSAQSADTALIEAVSARRLWPDSKIVLLYEYASPADFQNLLTSEINGCVSWSVSLESVCGACRARCSASRRQSGRPSSGWRLMVSSVPLSLTMVAGLARARGRSVVQLARYPQCPTARCRPPSPGTHACSRRPSPGCGSVARRSSGRRRSPALQRWLAMCGVSIGRARARSLVCARHGGAPSDAPRGRSSERRFLLTI